MLERAATMRNSSLSTSEKSSKEPTLPSSSSASLRPSVDSMWVWDSVLRGIALMTRSNEVNLSGKTTQVFIVAIGTERMSNLLCRSACGGVKCDLDTPIAARNGHRWGSVRRGQVTFGHLETGILFSLTARLTPLFARQDGTRREELHGRAGAAPFDQGGAIHRIERTSRP